MPDAFGAIQFPVAAPVGTAAPGDPALSYVASFLASALNAQCGAMWRTSGVCPGRQVVEKTFTHDPKKLFDDSHLPSLYVWEAQSMAEFLCSDILEDKRKLNIFWVMEPAEDDIQAHRSSVVNAIGKTIQRAIHYGRDTSWIVTGDTDPIAATEGSLFMYWAGLTRITRAVATPQELELVVNGDRGRPVAFPGLALSIDVRELLTQDISINTYDAAIDFTIGNADDDEMGQYADGVTPA